jgi:3-hydroxy-3-methylglutaryl CoA synthase
MARKPTVETVDAQIGETTALATPSQHSTHGLVYDASDIEIPKGNIIQKISNIEGPLGSLVVDRKHVVALAQTPVDAYVVRASKSWREDVPFGEQGAFAATEEQYKECVAQGLKMLENAEISLMIPAPEDFDEAAFPFPFGDKNYALARIYVSKDGYRQTYKRLVTYSASSGRDPRERVWTFESQLLHKGPHAYYAPSLSISSREPDAAVMAFIQSF